MMKIKSVFLTAILMAVICISSTVSAACPSMDLSGNCRVDLVDFSLLAGQWLTVYDPNDLDAMALEWLTEGIPADPAGMVWVYINDPGVSGHEPFNGDMSKYLTTNAQYCQYLNAAKAANQITVYNNYVYAASDTSYSHPYFYTYAVNSHSQITYSSSTFSVRSRDGYSMDNHPVVEVTWYGATAFCDYYGYRLPTEWEWRAVADYDGSYTYGCGTTISQSQANYYDNVNGFTNPLGLTGYPYTSPVGYYPAYGYGMCDMAGNVLEWTSSLSASTDPVIRGGGWDHYGGYCAVSYWDTCPPGWATNYIGFRVCR